MPRVIRQALGERIRRDADLQAFITHFRTATGVTVEFVGPLGDRDESARNGSPFCTWLRRDQAGCRACLRFQQNLLEGVGSEPLTWECAAGLCETAVPMRAGGSTLGYLVTGGYLPRPCDHARIEQIHAQLTQAGVTASLAELAPVLRRAAIVPAERQAALLALLQLVIEHLTAKITDRLAAPESTLPELIQRTCRIVDAEYTQPLSVPDIAHRLAVSEGHLSRSFHRATGLRFVEYIARFRAERARELLRTTSRSITEIAFACGFHSLSQFNRVFKAQFGVRPTDARNAAREPLRGAA